ncbi:uncharacterized protein C8R40DRAFT_1073466 [Lentinula edodes]|uniref:uncharacterized protein n=1 Tax=Lentinula edodes TaxID=5353 RepID=UPI001E8E8EFF|nr:uncharacterized protein C8R40DRAFT_1073466 [Lentinula edodes]KAH7870209.1 hypothetical protein C8R40DRAFT_1073466 [Lentinula edodes]
MSVDSRTFEQIIEACKASISQRRNIKKWNGINVEQIVNIILMAKKNTSEEYDIWRKIPNDKKPVWRINELYFTSVKRTRVSPGCVNFSPGWLAQGHHGPDYPLLSSTTLTYGNPEQVKIWLEQIKTAQLLSNILLRLLHPKLYKAGLRTLEGLQQLPQTKEWALQWKSGIKRTSGLKWGKQVF